MARTYARASVVNVAGDLVVSLAFTTLAVRSMSAMRAEARRVVAEERRRDAVAAAAAAEVRLLPIRPRSRGARRSLRTLSVVTLHPRFPFNV